VRGLKKCQECGFTCKREYFGGNQYIIEKYWESGRGQICPRCCKFGHFEGCTDMVKCYLCGGHHLAKDHLCPVNNCGKRTPCSHLPLKCTNCLGKHYTTSVKCPKKWEDIRLAKEKPKTFWSTALERPQATQEPSRATQEAPRTPRTPNQPQGSLDVDIDALSISPAPSLPLPSLPATPTPAGLVSQNIQEY